MNKIKSKKSVKKKLILFDSITKKSQDEKVSIWIGEKGTYVFKRFEKSGINSPISQVFLNRNYLTGVFKTKQVGIYSGDIKQNEKKRYILFKVIDQDKIEIFEKV